MPVPKTMPSRFGSGPSIARLERWTQSIAGFIAPPPPRRGAKLVEPQHAPFPGFIAWKLSTGAYYKDGGRPWQLADVRPGVCYVGLAYKRRDSTADDRFAVCAAQMFLSSGEGVVFRGALGPWYRTDFKQFHLDRAAARDLVAMVVNEYRAQHKNEPPSELFLHAKSSFTDEEWEGFKSGAPPETPMSWASRLPTPRTT